MHPKPSSHSGRIVGDSSLRTTSLVSRMGRRFEPSRQLSPPNFWQRLFQDIASSGKEPGALLLISQSYDRADTHGPTSRYVAREQCHTTEKQCDTGEGERISAGNF